MDKVISHNGKKFRWDRPPANTGAPGQDFQCFPGDSIVTSLKGAKKLFRRLYRGKLTELVTTDGVLSATPNHPILTDRGWIPVNEINVGDYLIHITDKRQSFANLNENKSSITFEQIFDLISLAFPFSKIPGSSSQFHVLTSVAIPIATDFFTIRFGAFPTFSFNDSASLWASSE